MSDVRELLARLNQTSVRFNVGSGGIPELTPQDIAAALAFIPAGLGREVFIAIWWPDGGERSVDRLDRQLQELIYGELRGRIQTFQTAKLELLMAQEGVFATRRVPSEVQRVVSNLEVQVENAKSRVWPTNPEMYPRIRAAVIEELRNPRNCRNCAGRGTLRNDDLVVECDRCKGQGSVQSSDRSRAETLNRDVSSYQRNGWKDIYEWVYREVQTVESEACHQFLRAVGR